MYASTFEAQVDVLKVVAASEDHCAPVVFYMNVTDEKPKEIGTSGEFVDVREVIRELGNIPRNNWGRSYFYEGMIIDKTCTEKETWLDTKFKGKIVIASINWGS
ncbi:MAG: hypothetical protein CBC65_000070 [Rhodothermaceae bacterium TMED105]|jgi:hypothetical protein|nr:MAG: hypothetical protein CBC65_000235 [Rhodothermaceae bacterium TMED105]RPF82663.1 MAG: hypothetical protein CBC65_000070 [Rhodothermaceae bacterium TMED105]|tara:strand:- start:11455 stop:11766 length:312 start_codon:yes stop_codon:yes gene_type:complete